MGWDWFEELTWFLEKKTNGKRSHPSSPPNLRPTPAVGLEGSGCSEVKSVQAALIPAINGMNVVGLVSIPGMMRPGADLSPSIRGLW